VLGRGQPWRNLPNGENRRHTAQTWATWANASGPREARPGSNQSDDIIPSARSSQGLIFMGAHARAPKEEMSAAAAHRRAVRRIFIRLGTVHDFS
jgi:hypothetical protein